ncbi:hypothetical protein EDD53_2164 [Pacificibacter maritimus]|uniref:Uncharacterized protein n=1 Tax=Pacificibacter maritimus TaxID=762213 RepID=A0A3N4UGT8_9RHOB|nr:hypothetical protein [Pacificibacter maritimus]RPE66461.1 hypothetical protein EDD53_2164 [Pacificibacter maritimus]
MTRKNTRTNLGRGPETEHFAKLIRRMMQTEAWRALSPVAQALYPWLKLEWRGPNANNNGKIRLSTRQAAEMIGVSRNTAAKAFHCLQAKGFLVVTEPGCLGSFGDAKGPAYELTEIALPYGSGNVGRQLYQAWKEGNEFPVRKARANNPVGSNGKTKPCHHDGDRNVVNFMTNKINTS